MLKIKEEKMGELEKFGFFEIYEDDDFWFYGEMGDDRYTNEPKYECCILKKNNDKYGVEERVIYTEADYIPNIIYNLIKADMVEMCDD